MFPGKSHVPRDAIPVLDLAGLDTALLFRASRELGIFRLRGSGVDIASVLNASRALFAIPEAAKASAMGPGGGGGFRRGYIPLAGESGLAEYVELKEGFCYGFPHEDAADDGQRQLRAAASGAPVGSPLLAQNEWPARERELLGEAWRPTLLRFFNDSLRVSETLGRALSPLLGRRADFLANLSAGGELTSLMRLFHYYPTDHEPDLARGTPRIGSSPHTDWHLLTVVLQDTEGGLQAQRRDEARGEWLDIPAREGELIVILGDYMHALSGGATTSPVHRVLLPPPGHERYSFTFFHYPNYRATVPPDSARRAARRAVRRAGRARGGAWWQRWWQRRWRDVGAARGGSSGYNTLVDAADEFGTLSSRPWGEFLLDKWSGVASNRVADAGDGDVAVGGEERREAADEL